MNPPSQQDSLGNQQHPPVAPGLFVNQTTSDGKLWVSNVRRSIVKTQSFCGWFACGFCITVICFPFFSNGLDSLDGGVWTGVVAIVTGHLGSGSLTKKAMVIPYRRASIFTAIWCGLGFTNIILEAVISGYRAYRFMAIVLGTYFFILMVISMIGAIFTCGALSFATTQPQQVVKYTPLPLHQEYVSSSLYTVAAAQSDVVKHPLPLL